MKEPGDRYAVVHEDDPTLFWNGGAWVHDETILDRGTPLPEHGRWMRIDPTCDGMIERRQRV